MYAQLKKSKGHNGILDCNYTATENSSLKKSKENLDAKAAAVIQKVGLYDYLTGNLTEDEKDGLYLRRSSYNPLNWIAQNKNENFEQNNQAYHSTSVHGAQNSLQNIRNRHYANPGGPRGMSAMMNTLTGAVGNIRRQQHSSRFASSSWEAHVRNEAREQFNTAANAVGLNVVWNDTPPPFRAVIPGLSSSMFFITYSNPITGNYEVGVTSNRPNIGAERRSQVTNVAKVTINYYQLPGNRVSAWIGQMFPVPIATRADNTGPVQVANFHGTAWSLSDLSPIND
ncbi:hypothetical protein [Pseudoalteromonas sp. OANN1]|uniref:hypothetical protein n=1 Tax=Pseudoalteromonas sp. OANN1 TaxID=2954497 RepID=UPI0020978BF7|nr:hypothetical protein [Pseudoalteromonas sp. OANN1]MCO7198534.1 hypothetical protein [Pseudoalteromonas sp. OANN1]